MSDWSGRLLLDPFPRNGPRYRTTDTLPEEEAEIDPGGKCRWDVVQRPLRAKHMTYGELRLMRLGQTVKDHPLRKVAWAHNVMVSHVTARIQHGLKESVEALLRL